MRSRTSDWYETKIRYEKTMEDGMQKKVSEQYVVDALSFTEAENKIIEEMSSYISGEFTITDIKHASYKEIFFSENVNDDANKKQILLLKQDLKELKKLRKENIAIIELHKQKLTKMGVIKTIGTSAKTYKRMIYNKRSA